MRPACGDIKGPPTGRIPISYIQGNVEIRGWIEEFENNNSRLCQLVRCDVTIAIKRNYTRNYKITNLLEGRTDKFRLNNRN